MRREVAKDLTAAKEQYRVRKALGREANIEGKKNHRHSDEQRDGVEYVGVTLCKKWSKASSVDAR